MIITPRHSNLLMKFARFATEMALPRRLISGVLSLLRGLYYLVFYGEQPRRIKRYVQNEEFDWVWRLADLAFEHEPAMQHLLERWLSAREADGSALGGWCDEPDGRDVFSFRGSTGGGRGDLDQGDGLVAQRVRRRRRRRR